MKDHAPRILAGEFKGRALCVRTGLRTRPLRALARRSLFDILGPEVVGTRFLDLFAGAGTVGFEALSRGAAAVVVVDAERAALDALRRSQAALGVQDRVRVVGADALQFVRAERAAAAAYDLVYLGPPYPLYQGAASAALFALFDELHGILAPHGSAILEVPAQAAMPRPVGLALAQQRRYGESVLGFYELIPPLPC